MITVTRNTCPACFQTELVSGTCPACGFCEEEEPVRELALPYFSILNQIYLTGKILGVGGFGITYVAQNMDSGMLCCIKEYAPDGIGAWRDQSGKLIVPSEYVREFGKGQQRFLEEARTLQTLRNNITVVNIWDFFEENNTAYFVMEYLDGCNMRVYQQKHVQHREMLEKAALQMLLSVGSALMEVHRCGLIHGDISPENIIITKSEDIKLIDFGAARTYTDTGKIQKGKIFLKSGYAPYEQHTANGRIGPWTDVYSLAATYYAVMTGQKVPDARDRMHQDRYQSLGQLCPDMKPGIASVIDRALEVDYRDRYESMKAFMDALGPFLSTAKWPKRLEPVQMEKTRYPEVRETEREHKEPEREKDNSQSGGRKKIWLLGKNARKKMERRIYLEMHTASGAVRSWAIPADTMVMIGRLPTCQIVLPPDERLSRKHCTLQYDSQKGTFQLTDYSSLGTYLNNGVRLLKGSPYAVQEGEYFYMAVPGFRFRLVEDGT